MPLILIETPVTNELKSAVPPPIDDRQRAFDRGMRPGSRWEVDGQRTLSGRLTGGCDRGMRPGEPMGS